MFRIRQQDRARQNEATSTSDSVATGSTRSGQERRGRELAPKAARAIGKRQRPFVGTLALLGVVLSLLGAAAAQDIWFDAPSADGVEMVQVDLADPNSFESAFRVRLLFTNYSPDPLQLFVRTNAPFPIAIMELDDLGHVEDEHYVLAAAEGTVLSSTPTQLARNILPMEPEDDERALEIAFKVTLLEPGGVLAPAGTYSLSFGFDENSTPITLDFSKFFECLQEDFAGHPQCEEGWYGVDIDASGFFNEIPGDD